MLKTARRHRLASQRLIINLFMVLTPPAFGVSTRQPSFPAHVRLPVIYILAYLPKSEDRDTDNGELTDAGITVTDGRRSGLMPLQKRLSVTQFTPEIATVTLPYNVPSRIKARSSRSAVTEQVTAVKMPSISGNPALYPPAFPSLPQARKARSRKNTQHQGYRSENSLCSFQIA